MNLTTLGRPIHQTPDGDDFLFMNSSIPSEKEKGFKDFVGLKFTLFQKNPYIFGLNNNKVHELLIGPKKLRETFALILKSNSPLNIPFILNFKDTSENKKVILIDNENEKNMIFNEIEYLNRRWKS